MSAKDFDARKAVCQKPANPEAYGGIEPKPWVVLKGIRGESARDVPGTQARSTKVAAATTFLCEVCPIREACEQEGREGGYSGVWGGKYLVGGEYDSAINEKIQDAKRSIAQG